GGRHLGVDVLGPVRGGLKSGLGIHPLQTADQTYLGELALGLGVLGVGLDRLLVGGGSGLEVPAVQRLLGLDVHGTPLGLLRRLGLLGLGIGVPLHGAGVALREHALFGQCREDLTKTLAQLVLG